MALYTNHDFINMILGARRTVGDYVLRAGETASQIPANDPIASRRRFLAAHRHMARALVLIALAQDQLTQGD